MLIPVAAEPFGPGGVFVVQAENIVFKKKDHEDRVCSFPKRYFSAPAEVDRAVDPGTFITCWAKLQTKDMFFYMLMTE